ncbi:FlgD Ig-like domain-containing protein [Hymenobacter gelipurpurascens]|uniref:FlgD Ig-like domain-containing protein n=1 Tax=Hymenobacter gelipurpurascens TaxID=89968 RepID=A0A212UC52_9BACT|nr:lamin tail domain-containing protein [Hymenobacter gelipurpurascens]SNC75807.1 FlgD Ig-like domain-containing protein [Hymenobacter gelipurpurascens]
MKKLLVLPLLLCAAAASAQLTDSFTDGNFTQNPPWSGDAASFQVNTAQQLQSNGPATTGTVLQLVTPCAATTGTTWELWANLKLATSSGNYADVWLMADQADLKASGTKGYFVRLGGTPDEVALFRKDATGSPVYVINGQDATLNSVNNNLVRVRVTRTVQNQWKLERDLTGGVAYTSEGTATDATYQRSAWFGIMLTYSAANSKAFYFDDFRVTDATPPLLGRATVPAAQQLDLTFNEAVALGQSAANYRLSTGLVALTAQLDATDPTIVHLTFAADLPIGSLTVEARNVADQFGNVAAGPLTATVQNNGFPVAPKLNQVLITEILADEIPVVGLPASEYIEIHNPSATALLDLAGVRLLKPGGTPAVFPAGAVLLPGEYAVVCGSTRAAQFGAYRKVFGLSNFPSLTNSGDQLVLRGKDGRTLFEVSYADTWYKDTRKKDGGWTLEMIDTANPCGGLENWTASLDASGGTPGRANSVRAANPDRTAPKLLRTLALSASSVRLFFGEKLDSTAAANPALYALSAGPTITGAAPVGPDFRVVDLSLGSPLTANQPLTITVQRAVDCAGNAAGPASSAMFALPVPVSSGDVVINEILFNPRSGGVDFVELLNRSTKYLDLRGWQLGGLKTDGSIGLEAISPESYVLGPGQFVVLTTRPDLVQAQYPANNLAAFLTMSAFPSYPDDAGTVVVQNALGQELDRYAYTEKQHLALLDSRDGVSLERIRATGPSLPVNFHSAASSVGYATPGRPNSQQQPDPTGTGVLTLEPEIFTPDEDGQQDFTTLSYQLDQPGYAGTVTIYDAQGRLVRRLVRNETLATTGFWQWDGLNDKAQKAAVGYYVLLVELFRASGGEKREYRKTVVVGARF